MPKRTLIRGRNICSKFVVSILGSIPCLFLFALTLSHLMKSAITFGTLSLICISLAVWFYWKNAREKAWITVRDDGFDFGNRDGLREFNDTDVSAVSSVKVARHFNGEHTGYRHRATLTIGTDETERSISLDYIVSDGDPDPARRLLKRLSKQILHRARDRSSRGEAVDGKGWSLDRNGLTITDASGELFVPIGEISTVEVVDLHLNVWVIDEMFPAIRIPASGPNVGLLERLLDERIDASAKQPEPREDDAEGDLGRVVFQRDRSITQPLLSFLILLAVALVLCAVYSIAGEGLLKGVHITAPVGLICFCAGIGTSIITIVYRRNHLVCYRKGISRTSFRGTRTLKYSEIESFSFSVTRHYRKGIYTGSRFELVFEPWPNVPSRPIRFSLTVYGNDNALDELRDFVSERIAREKRKRLAHR